jgi:MFS family permease
VRTFAFGAVSITLALYLAALGLSAAQVGAVLTATLLEDAAATLLAPAIARRWGLRRTLTLWAGVLTASAVALCLTVHPALAVTCIVLGMVGPSGQDAGPLGALEQAILPALVGAERRTHAFAWYSFAGYLPPALGALAGGALVAGARAAGLAELSGLRAAFVLHALAGAGLLALYRRLPPAVEAAAAPAGRGAGDAARSRPVVIKLAALQAMDAFGGGFVVQTLLVYWFHVRFGLDAPALAPLFFGTNLLSGISFAAAVPLARRFGLLNTMVFTHLPSNVLLLLVPLAPSYPLAAAALLARHLLPQMDVPTRQAFTMALVPPAERTTAAAWTAGARGLAQAAAPAVAGRVMAQAASALPFAIAGGVKIAYDLALFFSFRRVSAGERGTSGRQGMLAR